MKKTKVLSTIDEIKAFSDPYRIQILFVFKNLDRPSTVKEVADEMGEVPAKVHYHVKKLESVGVLELVYTKEINGIIAKYYEPTAEKFKIESKPMDSTVEALLLDESRKVIASVYDDSKKIVFESLDTQEDNDVAALHTATLYLTDKDVEYVQNVINDLTEKYKRKSDNNEDKKPHHFFNALFTMNDKNPKG